MLVSISFSNLIDEINPLSFALAFPQAISTLFQEAEIKNEQLDTIPVCYQLIENETTSPHQNDQSSLHTFATALNLCHQRNLFQLYRHCQSIVILGKTIR